MEKEEKMLTIGQFAALHGVNKKTLMWYDETGLFRPAAVDPDNGYRYYSYRQSSALETILLLRELEMSLEEIRGFMQSRSAAGLEALLSQKIEETGQKIQRLKALKKTLCNRRRDMRTLLTMDLSEISVVELPARRLIVVETSPDINFEKQAELAAAETRKYQLRRLHDAVYGVMIGAESLYRGDFSAYSRMFIELPFRPPKANLSSRPGGAYLRAFYQGEWGGLPERYREILEYARQNRLELVDFAYETGINETTIDRIEDYIVQIEIPIRPML